MDWIVQTGAGRYLYERFSNNFTEPLDPGKEIYYLYDILMMR
jgi:hypothetical protein